MWVKAQCLLAVEVLVEMEFGKQASGTLSKGLVSYRPNLRELKHAGKLLLRVALRKSLSIALTAERERMYFWFTLDSDFIETYSRRTPYTKLVIESFINTCGGHKTLNAAHMEADQTTVLS